MDPIELLLRHLDQAYDHVSWHGTNLRGSIRRLVSETAVWRPGQGRHNVAEIVVHAAYWKYVVTRRILGLKRGSFPLQGSNWFPRDLPYDMEAWKEDVALLERMHVDLRAAVAGFPAKSLDASPPSSKVSNWQLLSGIAAHDLYHAGQIQTLKALQRPA